MFNLFAEALAQAREFVDAIAVLITEFLATHGEQALRAEIANRLYEFVAPLHTILCTKILGDDACNDELDALFEMEAPRGSFLTILHDMRRDLIIALMHGFPIIKLETQLLSQGRVSLPSLILLCVAALQRIEHEINPLSVKTHAFARDFRCVRRHALQASEEQLTTAVQDLSVHGTMNALYAVYAASPDAPYSEEFERYTGLVLRRALDLLMTPGDTHMWNIHAYRTAITMTDDETPTYRFSALLLRDVTLVWHALSDHFDLAHLLPLNHNPRSVCEPNREHLRLARQWLLRNAVPETDVRVRDNLVRLKLRAGELDMYYAEHRAQHATPELVLKDHRPQDFYVLMETAPTPSQVVLHATLQSDAEFAAAGPRAQVESLHLSLVVLETFKARLKAAEKNLDPEAYVVLSHELRKWSPYLQQCRDRPILLLLFNHVQVWFGGEVLMYNSALEAVCAWMLLVDEKCGQRVDRHSVLPMLDDFLRPHEQPSERLARLAAHRSCEVPALGSGGVF